MRYVEVEVKSLLGCEMGGVRCWRYRLAIKMGRGGDLTSQERAFVNNKIVQNWDSEKRQIKEVCRSSYLEVFTLFIHCHTSYVCYYLYISMLLIFMAHSYIRFIKQ